MQISLNPTYWIPLTLTQAQLEAIDQKNALIQQMLPGIAPRTRPDLLCQALFIGLHHMGIPLECRDQVLMLPVRLVEAPDVPEAPEVQSAAPARRINSLRDIPVDEVLNRIHHALEVANDIELGQKINVPFNTLKQWRYRNAVPVSVMVRLAVRYGLSLDWLYKGEGHPKRDTTPI